MLVVQKYLFSYFVAFLKLISVGVSIIKVISKLNNSVSRDNLHFRRVPSFLHVCENRTQDGMFAQ